MALQFLYPPANSLAMQLIQTFDSSYNTVPFDYQSDIIPYAQKRQTDDTEYLQVFSDWVPTLKIFNCNGTPKTTINPTTPVISIIGETYTCYEFEIDWGAIGSGDYYGEIYYDENSTPAPLNYSLKEVTFPNFVDGNLQVKSNGIDIQDVTSTGSGTLNLPAGLSYSFEATSLITSTDPNPRIRLTVKKNGIVIFDQSEVQTNTSSILYSGIAQPGAIYTASVVTDSNAVQVTPINIADNAAVLPNIQTYQSRPIQVAINWPQTLKFQYTNSKNAFGMVFIHSDLTQLTLMLRVEGNIPQGEYTPGFEDVIYTDQEANVTKLNAVIFREYMLYIASNTSFGGVPSWQADKVNWAFGCDQIQIDGVYYQNATSTKWDVQRTDPLGSQFLGLSMTIREVDNRFLQSLKTGVAPPTGFTIVELVDNYLGKGADFNVSTFKKYSLLKNITIINYGAAFTLNIGTAAAGNNVVKNEVIEVPTDYEGHNISLHIPFLSAQTLYLTGLTAGSANCDILFDYCQYDALPITPPTPAVTSEYGPNDIGMWEADAPTDFNRDWDLSTGLGKTGSRYFMCRMCDGRNNTVDRGGSVALAYCQDNTHPGWVNSPPPWYAPGQTSTGYDSLAVPGTPQVLGVPSIKLALENLAPHSHGINTTSSATSTLLEVDPIRGHLAGNPAGNRSGDGTYTNNAAGNGTNQYGPGGDGMNDVQTIRLAGGDKTPGDAFGSAVENRQLSIVTLFFKGPAA